MSEPIGAGEHAADPEGTTAGMIGGRYRLERILGQGSSARTLLCGDLREDRQVAVKELHFAHLENWKFLDQFEREAKMLAMLEHPGIPRVFDYFPGDGGASTLYIVQEFIEGASLQQRMESGPMLGQEEIYDLALSMLDVLEYLHGRAPPVLHRDIKPSNILLRPDGKAALIDFGGVCVGWRPPGLAGTTVVGTFGYMPPEQLVGQSGPTSDLYALGATLLHVVTGRAPSDFSFDSGRIEVPPTLPIKQSLARLIEALLRPAPRDRPQSVEAARRILQGEDPDRGHALTLKAPAHPTPTPRRNITYSTAEGPRFVDMGDPPRDPKGEFRDVYRNLIHPLFPARRLWSPAVHAIWVGFSGLIAVGTVGVAPGLYSWGAARRKAKYGDLFRYGHTASGTIVSSRVTGALATFRYEFDVGSTWYVAFMDYAMEMNRYWGPGDTVPVLYDPDDPGQSCFVYR